MPFLSAKWLHVIGTIIIIQQNYEFFNLWRKFAYGKKKNKNFAYTTHRIGSTTYKVKVVFNDSSTETMEDKILRIIRNEVHTNCEKYDIIKAPQMSRQSERSAS